MEIGSATTASLTDLKKQLQEDQRTLVQHQRAGADQAVLAADQAQVAQDQAAITAARVSSSSTGTDGTGGTVDVLA